MVRPSGKWQYNCECDDVGKRPKKPEPCPKKCPICKDEDHHWLEECDDSGEPVLICKHCSVIKPYESEPEPIMLYIDTDGMRRDAQSVKDGQGTPAGSMAKMVIDCCDYIDQLNTELAEARKKPAPTEFEDKAEEILWAGRNTDSPETQGFVNEALAEIDRLTAELKDKGKKIANLEIAINTVLGHLRTDIMEQGVVKHCEKVIEQALKEKSCY